MNGLPDLRSLPDAPVPDGRTVLTNRDARGAEAVMGHGRHLQRFILDTNAIEALNRQLRKALKTKGHFPNEDAARKLIYLALTKRRPAMDPMPELDDRAAGVQDPLRRSAARHHQLTVTRSHQSE